MAFGLDFISSLISGDLSGAGTALVSGGSDVLDFISGSEGDLVGGTADIPSATSAAELFSTAAPVIDQSSGVLDFLTDPSVFQALAAGGVSLGNTLINKETTEDTRKFNREEAETSRQFTAEQQQAARDHSSAEAEKTRQFSAEQKAADREFQAGQAEASKRFNALIQLQNGRRSIMQSKAQTRAQSGSGNSNPFGNINQALLSG